MNRERCTNPFVHAAGVLPVLAVWGGLLLGVGGRCGFAQSGAVKKGGAMPTIELEAGPERAEVLAGEPIYVNITLTNLGKQPVEAPSPIDAPPWEFRLRGEGAAPSYTLSTQRFRNRLPEPSRPQPPLMETLRPMSMLEYRVDLLWVAVEPIAPGKYELTAEYRMGDQSLRSQPTPLTVAVPNVAAYSVLGQAPEGTFASAFLHLAADGSSALYQRETSQEPPIGAAYSRVIAPAGKSIGSFALGYPIDRWRSARWIGWIEGDALYALLGSGEKVWAQIDAVPTGLHAPVLAKPAYQLFDGHVVFFAYGLKDGKPYLHRITLKHHEPATFAAVELPSLPHGNVLAQYVGTTLILVWVEHANGHYAVEANACPFGPSTAKGVKRTLVTGDQPVLAFDVTPLAATPGEVDVLLGATGGPLSLEYRRLPMAGESPQSAWKLPDPRLKPGEHVAAWAVLAGDAQRAPVALLTSARLLSMDFPSDSGWKSTAAAAGGHYLTLFRVPESALWCTWADPQTGLRYLKVD